MTKALEIIGDTYLSLDLTGEVDLSRRVPTEHANAWGSEKLIEVEDQRIDFMVGIDAQEPTVTLRLAVYHVEAKGTDQAYHAYLNAKVPMKDLCVLHAYLGFLIGLGGASSGGHSNG